MLKNDISIRNEITMICVLFLTITDKSLIGKNPPDEIIVNAKFNELKDLIEIVLRIIKINSVKLEYNKNILIACLNTSELSNEIKFVRVFLKFSSYISIKKIIEYKK